MICLPMLSPVCPRLTICSFFASSDDDMLSPEQIENIVEFLPTKDERNKLEKYMLEGDQDAAEKFDGLCECEKFMVSMMTVKHAKRKVRALLFKLQFMSCLESIAEGECLLFFLSSMHV
jgi:hypothetical protein